MDKTITVLIPVYNREKFIERSLRSIMRQAYQDLKILIYNDGSTDNTISIIKSLQNEDNRIFFIEGKINKGVGYARNQLLKACTTTHAVWMDSDDISNHQRIQLQYEQANKYQNSMIFCSWQNLKKVVQSPKWLDTIIEYDNPSKGFATLMFPVDKTTIFDETMCFGAEDAKWRKNMSNKYPEEIKINKQLYYIDFHGNRIGSWKRKICKDWGGIYNPEDIKGLSYSEIIEQYEKRNQ